MPKNVTKNVTKVVYKPDTQSTDEYIIMVNPVEFKKWKSGGEPLFVSRDDDPLLSKRHRSLDLFQDRTIPLADVVDSFEIFYSAQGSQGFLGRPSNQQLENKFGTSKDYEVVEILLERGKEQASEGFHSGGMYSKNATRGSAVLDSKGKGLSGI